MSDTPANVSNPTKDPRTQAPTPAAPPSQSPPVPKGSRGLPPQLEVTNRAMGDPELMALDPKSLDPNRAYRYVRIEQSGRPVLRKKLKGWQVETVREGGPRPLVEIEKRGDNAIVIGDGILMSRPRALHEQRVKMQQARTEELLNSTTAMVEAEAEAKGLKLIQDTDHLRPRNQALSTGESG